MQQASQNSHRSSGAAVPKGLVLGATAMIAYGLSRRSRAGTALAAAGGLLAYKAATTHPSANRNAHANFLINAPAEQAYALWHRFENLPRFMAHLKSVRMVDNTRSEWVAAGPGGREIHWTAELTEDIPDQRIAWHSLPGSDIETSGSVHFRQDPQGRGCYVTADVQYGLPGGPLASGLATLFGKHPEFVVREDLRRFKALLETGEVPTTVGQTHGPRGLHGHTEQILFRETSNHPEPQAQPQLAQTA